VRKVLAKAEALDLFRKMGQTHKLELIEAKPAPRRRRKGRASRGTRSPPTRTATSPISARPHVDRTGRLKHFKLLNVFGSYLLGAIPRDTRSSGSTAVAWPTSDELKKDVARHESAAERDTGRSARS